MNHISQIALYIDSRHTYFLHAYTLIFAILSAWVSVSPGIRCFYIPAFGIWLACIKSCPIEKQNYYVYLYYSLFITFASYWIVYCLESFMSLPFAISWTLGLLAFSFVALIHSIPVILCIRYLGLQHFPLILTCSEYIRQPFFWAIPWSWQAYAVMDMPLLTQLLPLGGQYLAGYIVCLLALCFAYSILNNSMRPLLYIVGIYICLGFWSLLSFDRPIHTQAIQVNLLQGNVATIDKLQPQKSWNIYRSLLEKTDDTTLNILPEGVLYHRADEKSLQELQQHHLLKNSFIGTSLKYDDFSPALVGTGQAHGTYHKQILVPFGEFIPLMHFLPSTLWHILPDLPHDVAHSNQDLLRFSDHVIYPMICYELFFPPIDKNWLSRSSFLIVSGENTWYNNSIINQQFILSARMRALENAKPLLLTLNRGPSSMIDAKGKVLNGLPYDSDGILSLSFTPEIQFTVYQNVPDFVILLILIIMHCATTLGYRYERTTRLFSS